MQKFKLMLPHRPLLFSRKVAYCVLSDGIKLPSLSPLQILIGLMMPKRTMQEPRASTWKVTNLFPPLMTWLQMTDNLRVCFKYDKFSKKFERLGVLVSGPLPTCHPTGIACRPNGICSGSAAKHWCNTPWQWRQQQLCVPNLRVFAYFTAWY